MGLFAWHVAEKHIHTLMRASCSSLSPQTSSTRRLQMNSHSHYSTENTFVVKTKVELLRSLTASCSLSALLLKAHSTPFQVKPSTMASVVKGLYTLRPGRCHSLWCLCALCTTCADTCMFLRIVFHADWVRLAPLLFSSFIPQTNPPVQECELLDYAAQDRRLQAELSRNGFAR